MASGRYSRHDDVEVSLDVLHLKEGVLFNYREQFFKGIRVWVQQAERECPHLNITEGSLKWHMQDSPLGIPPFERMEVFDSKPH